MLRTRRMPWPGQVDVQQRRPPEAPADAGAVVTFVGHSTFLVQAKGVALLIDPVFSNCAGPFGILGPRRVRRPGVALADLPPIDVILVSHNHYDHCDLATLRGLKRSFDPQFVSPAGNLRTLRKTGSSRVIELDWWESASVAGVAVTVTPAQHFSARTPWDRNRALWGGFSIRIGGRHVYFAGDTGYMRHFRAIRERIGAIDLAILPIGAYEPRWFMQSLHMNPADAVQAHMDLGSPLAIASHFGTFRLTAEGIEEPVTALRHELEQNGTAPDRFHVLDTGASIGI